MWWKKAVLVSVLFVVLVPGVAHMAPSVTVGVDRSAFNSTTGTNVSLGFTSPDNFNGGVNIYDSNGILVRTFDTGDHASGDYSLPWHGDYGNGTWVPDGNYTINASLDLGRYLMTVKAGNANPRSSQLLFPMAVGVNASGYIFVGNFPEMAESLIPGYTSDRVYVYRPDGSFFSSFNSSINGLSIPLSFAFNSSGYIFIADGFDVRIFNPDYSYYGRLDKSAISSPSNFTGIAFNSTGFAYVADIGNDGIHIFSPDGTYIKSWGSKGNGIGQFDYPFSLAIDPLDHVYVLDNKNNRVQKFDCNGGFLKQWGSSGNDNGEFNDPYGIAIDNDSMIYVRDIRLGEFPRVQVFDSEGNFQRSWNYNYEQFLELSFIVFDRTTGHILNSELGMTGLQGVINVTDDHGNPVMMLHEPPPKPGDLYEAKDVAVNSSGYMYVIDKYDETIQVFDPDGSYAFSWSYPFPNQMGPESIAINRSGYVYVDVSDTILVFDSGGRFIEKWVTSPIMMDELAGWGQGIGIGPDDNVYVTCNVGPMESIFGDPCRVRVYSPEGRRLPLLIGPGYLWGMFKDALNGADPSVLNFLNYGGIAVNSTGFIYTTIPYNNSVLIFDHSGNLTTLLNGTNTGAGQFNGPTDIVINASDCVFILDSGNNRTMVLDRNGRLLAQFGTTGSGDGQFTDPQGLGIDPSNGDICIADTGNNRTQTFEYFGDYYGQVRVTVDNTAPITLALLNGTLNNGNYTGNVSVTLLASDTGSGMASTQYQLDGGTLQSYTGTFNVSAPGQHTIVYRSTDKAGNTENNNTTSFNIVNPGGYQWPHETIDLYYIVPGTTPMTTPMPTPTPTPTITSTVAPTLTPSATTTAEQNGGFPWWLLALLAVVITLAGAVYFYTRRG